ncbi:hypothetical protein LPJ67_001288 [Coemansia sp. RSA 1938]|nr:hypothetical protein LPJ67_001288 [Coemansia sp. RSA 1938]
MDNTTRGKLQPYMGMIKLLSTVSGLVVVSVGGLYIYINHYLDKNYPIRPEITSKATRKLLRGAALREHIAPDPQIAYMFMLSALEQIYSDGDLDESSEAVQEIIVRMAHAAAQIGEQKPAKQMLETAWDKVVDSDGRIHGLGDSESWRMQHVCRVADALGPLLMDCGEYKTAIRTYGTALQAARTMQNNDSDDLLLKQANYVTSLGEAFAMDKDYESARTLLSSVLMDIKKREQPKNVVDKWTCLDAVVMLDLAQVERQQGNVEKSQQWAETGLQETKKWKRVGACDNCQAHLLSHLAHLSESQNNVKEALGYYSLAIKHFQDTGTGNMEQMDTASRQLKQRLLESTK